MLSKDPFPLVTKSFKSFFNSLNLLIIPPLTVPPATGTDTFKANPPSINFSAFDMRSNISLRGSVNLSKKSNLSVIWDNLVLIDVNSLLLSSNFFIGLSIRDINLL